jgi:hypothetical protein
MQRVISRIISTVNRLTTPTVLGLVFGQILGCALVEQTLVNLTLLLDSNSFWIDMLAVEKGILLEV